MRLSAMAAAALLAVSAGSAASADTARDYNLLLSGNFSASSSDIEGRAAVGGSFTASNYSVGATLGSGNADTYNLIAGGAITFNGGSVKGNVLGSSISTSGFGYGSGNYGKTYATGGVSPIDIAGEMSRLSALSDALDNTPSAFGTVGTSLFQYSQYFLTGSDAKLDIFDLDGAKLAGYSGMVITVPTSAMVVFNISGGNVSMNSAGVSLNGSQLTNYNPYNTRVLYNFYDATQLAMSVAYGSVLAPGAAITAPYGVADGQVFARSLTGNMQINNQALRNFGDGTNLLDPTGPVPEPSAWAMMIVGFGAIGGSLRSAYRRRLAAA